MRALVVANRALMSRGHLEEQANNWLAEEGTLPPGNGVERDLWEVCSLTYSRLCRHSCANIVLACVFIRECVQSTDQPGALLASSCTTRGQDVPNW